MSEVKVSNIQEVFGQFAVVVSEDGKPTFFETHEAALVAETEFLKGAEFRDEAAAFVAYAGYKGKTVKTNSNTVIAYQLWVEAGRPEPVVPTVEEVEATETVEANEATVEVEGADVAF